ncbi:MAG: DUF58 domain-containing protein [Anaerolineae bacterium]
MSKRAIGFLIIAFMLYLFGNQTQIGWLYVMSALIAGLVVVGGLLSCGALRDIQLERSLSAENLYEGDEINVDLRVKRARGLAAYQVEMTEICPLAELSEREKRLYLPVIPSNQPLTYAYLVTLDRRGVYAFPPILMRTRFPFGFFRRHGRLTAPTQALVYPEVKPLLRFPLLEKQLAAQIATQRAGHGSEVIGVRPFRSGDSPRHIHWRSTARTGQLMSKEFADEAQPNLTLLLDTDFSGTAENKRNPFEWAVKSAVSIADHARRRGFPLFLRHGDSALSNVESALGWETFLQMMARIQPSPCEFADLCGQVPAGSMIAAVLPMPSMRHLAPLIEWKSRGSAVMVVLIDPSSFDPAAESAEPIRAALAAAGIDALLIDSSTVPADQLARSLAAATTQGTNPREANPSTSAAHA